MKLKIFSVILITLFTFFIVSDANAGLRGEAKKALSKAKKLVKSSRSSNEEIISALRYLENWSDKDITEFLVEDALPELAKQADKQPALDQAVKTLSKMVDAESQKYLAKQVFNKKVPGDVRCKILGKLLKDNSDVEMIKKGLADDAWKVRLVSVDFISERTLTNDEFVPYLKTLVNDGTNTLRKRVIIVLNKYANHRREEREKFVEIAEILINRLEIDKTVTRGQIIDVLERLSALNYGDAVPLWKNWLNKVKRGEEIKQEEGDRDSSLRPTVTYHDIETYSKRLIYIIDTSSSMEEDVDPALTSEGKKTENTGGNDDKDNKAKKIDWSKIKTKFDLAKAELIRSVWALEEPKVKKGDEADEGDMMFTIIAYNSEVLFWQENLVLSTRKNKSLAEQWINTLKTGKKTNIYGALSAGFEIAEGKKKKKKSESTGENEKDQDIQVDTIFFLTDGYATTGKYFGGLDEILNIYDTNMDSKLTRAEFRKMFSEVFTEEEVMDFFVVLDVDKNGYVTCSKGKNTKYEFDESIGTGGKQSNKAKFYYMQMDGMLREIAQRNEMLGIEVHTITIGKSAEADYTTMKKLAEITKGKYKRLGSKDERK